MRASGASSGSSRSCGASVSPRSRPAGRHRLQHPSQNSPGDLQGHAVPVRGHHVGGETAYGARQKKTSERVPAGTSQIPGPRQVSLASPEVSRLLRDAVAACRDDAHEVTEARGPPGRRIPQPAEPAPPGRCRLHPRIPAPATHCSPQEGTFSNRAATRSG
jgi:hypothetical protein